MIHEGQRSRGDLSLERAEEDLGQRFQLDRSLDDSGQDETSFGSSRVIHPHDGLGFDAALQVRRRPLDLNLAVSSGCNLARKTAGHPGEREARPLELECLLAGVVDEIRVNDVLTLPYMDQGTRQLSARGMARYRS